VVCACVRENIYVTCVHTTTQVLAEVPNQLTSYMDSKGIKARILETSFLFWLSLVNARKH
jgi:hypothetical protein